MILLYLFIGQIVLLPVAYLVKRLGNQSFRKWFFGTAFVMGVIAAVWVSVIPFLTVVAAFLITPAILTYGVLWLKEYLSPSASATLTQILLGCGALIIASGAFIAFYLLRGE